MKSGDEFLCSIEKLVYGGKGLARIDGVVVFTPGVLKGEKVRVRVTRMRKNFAEAELFQIEEASPDRIDCNCLINCRPAPGCVYAHLTPEAELAAKQEQYADFLNRIFGDVDIFLPPENSPAVLHYRNKITLHFSDGLLGYRQESSHLVVDTPKCPLANPEVNSLLSRFRSSKAFASLKNGDDVVFRSASGAGESVIRISRHGRKSFWNADTDVFETKCEPLLRECALCGMLEVKASGFYQVNREVSTAVAGHVADLYSDGRSKTPHVLDLFCGVGVFGILCAQCGALTSTGIESCGNAIELARKNAAACGVAARFIRASLTGGGAIHQKWIRDATRTTVIMDPPRGGADSGCIESVVKHRFAKVIYVSCDPATLARDAKLLAKGGYRPASAKLFNMFPRTARFESVTEFLSEENFSGK